MKCTENAEFPAFKLLRQAKTAPWKDEHSSAEEKLNAGRSKEGDWAYTGLMPGAKMEIPDESLAPVGAGGTGEVWKARAASTLNHPNICAVLVKYTLLPEEVSRWSVNPIMIVRI